MIKTKIKWGKGYSSEAVLFAVQRLSEMLFFYTKDTYKVKIFNSKILLSEYLHVYNSDNDKQRKNLPHIEEEVFDSLSVDKEAQELIGKSFYENMLKNFGNMDRKSKEKSIRYCLESLEGLKYINEIRRNLKEAINNDNEKKEIDRLLQQFVCEAKALGYDPRYINEGINRFFTKASTVVTKDSFTKFLDYFDFIRKEFDVVISEDKDLGDFSQKALKRIGREMEVLSDDAMANIGLVGIPGKTNIRLKGTYALDYYSAAENIRFILRSIESYYLYFRHTVNEEELTVFVNDGRKYRSVEKMVKGVEKSAKISGKINSELKANSVFVSALLRENDTMYILSRITEIHNTALRVDSASNALLDLWSILELLLEEETKDTDKSRIIQVIGMIEPFLANNYIRGLVDYLIQDFGRDEPVIYNEILNKVNEGIGEDEKMFFFLTQDSYDGLRKNVYARLDDYPLLRYRIFTLGENIKNGKQAYTLIERHIRRTSWQIYRIYRARNSIIHDGEAILFIDDLVENLHKYIDVLCDKIIDMISTEKKCESIETAIYYVKVSHEMYLKRLKNEYKDKQTLEIMTGDYE